MSALLPDVQALTSRQVAELLADLGYKRPLPVQSMYIFKVRL